MMRNVLLGVVFFILSTGSHAATWVGVEAGLGSADYKPASENINALWSGSVYAGQDLGHGLAAVIGLHTGSGSGVPAKDIGVATEADAELDYKAISLSSDWRFHLFGAHSLYAAVGVNYNQTTVELKSMKTIDDSGFGYNLRAGWQYALGDHALFNLGFQRLSLTDVDISSFNFGYEYRF